MLRVFLVSSHLNAVFQALYAKNTHKEGMIDVLIIDEYYKKETLTKAITETSTIYSWNYVLDFSNKINDSSNIKPSLRKKITRSIKHLPIIKNIYTALLKKHEKKQTIKSSQKLNMVFNQNHIPINLPTELYLLTQTFLNKALMNVFPNAKVNYMEHGTGDYYYVSGLKTDFNSFYCVFKATFQDFLNKKNLPKIAEKVHQYMSKENFEEAFLKVANKATTDYLLKEDKKYVLVLLDAFECYNPPLNFWTDFIDRCMSEIENKNEYVFLFKPHPNQSNDSIHISETHIKSLNIEYKMLNKKGEASVAVESLYVQNVDRISAVFTTFSSAVFYIAKFYPNNSKYYVLYDFVGKYTLSAPKQYKEIFNGLNEMITEVFDEGKIIRLK